MQQTGERAALDDGEAPAARAFAVVGAGPETTPNQAVVHDGQVLARNRFPQFAAQITSAALNALGGGGSNQRADEGIGGKGSEDERAPSGTDAASAQEAAGAGDGGFGHLVEFAIGEVAAEIKIVEVAGVVVATEGRLDGRLNHRPALLKSNAGGGGQGAFADRKDDLAGKFHVGLESKAGLEVGGGDLDDVLDVHPGDRIVEQPLDFLGGLRRWERPKVRVGGGLLRQSDGPLDGLIDVAGFAAADGGVSHAASGVGADGDAFALAGVGRLDAAFFDGDGDVARGTGRNVAPFGAEADGLFDAARSQVEVGFAFAHSASPPAGNRPACPPTTTSRTRT